MRLIVGLGNPGKEYVNNRHNVGFMVLDELAKKLRIKGFESSRGGKAEYTWTSLRDVKIELFRPLTFMNNSGTSVVYAYKKHSLSPHDLFVIHDDLDLPLGAYKIQKGRGPKEHKGLLSIYNSLHTSDFWHIRVGVDNRVKENRVSGEAYVLQDFGDEELKVLSLVVDKIVNDLLARLTNQPSN